MWKSISPILNDWLLPDPTERHAVYHAVDLNFRLRPVSKAVDAGILIPTVNDGFTDRAAGFGSTRSRQARA